MIKKRKKGAMEGRYIAILIAILLLIGVFLIFILRFKNALTPK